MTDTSRIVTTHPGICPPASARWSLEPFGAKGWVAVRCPSDFDGLMRERNGLREWAGSRRWLILAAPRGAAGCGSCAAPQASRCSGGWGSIWTGSAARPPTSDLYDDDILWWSEQQAELLRRVAAGERVNDQLVEEIESGGGPGPAVPAGR